MLRIRIGTSTNIKSEMRSFGPTSISFGLFSNVALSSDKRYKMRKTMIVLNEFAFSYLNCKTFLVLLSNYYGPVEVKKFFCCSKVICQFYPSSLLLFFFAFTQMMFTNQGAKVFSVYGPNFWHLLMQYQGNIFLEKVVESLRFAKIKTFF